MFWSVSVSFNRPRRLGQGTQLECSLCSSGTTHHHNMNEKVSDQQTFALLGMTMRSTEGPRTKIRLFAAVLDGVSRACWRCALSGPSALGAPRAAPGLRLLSCPVLRAAGSAALTSSLPQTIVVEQDSDGRCAPDPKQGCTFSLSSRTAE